MVSFRMVVLYCSVVHSSVVHSRVVHGRVAIRAACNKIVVFLMNGRLVSKRNCAITRETKIAAILARRRFIEQTRSIALFSI